MQAVAELLLIVKTIALTFIVAVLIKDVWNVMGGIIFAGDKLLEGETVVFQFVGLGLFLYVWHRYRVQTTTESSNE
jgi:thiamine transporter ThiT